jgi:hypothetical protein
MHDGTNILLDARMEVRNVRFNFALPTGSSTQCSCCSTSTVTQGSGKSPYRGGTNHGSHRGADGAARDSENNQTSNHSAYFDHCKGTNRITVQISNQASDKVTYSYAHGVVANKASHKLSQHITNS